MADARFQGSITNPVFRAQNVAVAQRIANWAGNNNIATSADVDAWAAANITTLTQARTLLVEIIKMLFDDHVGV